MGVLDAGANALFAVALTEGLASTVSVIGSLYPVTTVLLAALVRARRCGARGGGRLTYWSTSDSPSARKITLCALCTAMPTSALR